MGKGDREIISDSSYGCFCSEEDVVGISAHNYDFFSQELWKGCAEGRLTYEETVASAFNGSVRNWHVT